MKAISDVKMSKIIERFTQLHQPIYEACEYPPSANSILWRCSEQDLLENVSVYDEEDGTTTYIRGVRFFEIYLTYDEVSWHYVKVPVFAMRFNPVDGSSDIVMPAGTSEITNQPVSISVMYADGFWEVHAPAGVCIAVHILAY